jgi:hypothetical protein
MTVRKPTTIPLDLAMNYHSKYEITVESRALNPKKNKGYSRLRLAFHRFINALLVVAFVAMGFAGLTIPAAHAEPGNPLDLNHSCAKDVISYADATNAGSFDPVRPQGDVKLTGLEKFRYSTLRFPVVTRPWEKKDAPEGLKEANYKADSEFWAQNNGGCIKPMWHFNSVVATSLVNGASMISGLNGMIFDTAIRSGEKEGALATLSNTVERVITGHDSNNVSTATGKGLRDTLFINFLVPVIMCAAAFILFKTLISRKFTEALHDVMWLVGSLIVGVLILSNPMVIPRAAETVVSSASGAILSGITDTAMSIQPGGASSNLCSVGSESTGSDSSSRQVQCLLWYGTAFRPWQIGTFGTSEEQNLRAGEVPAVSMGGGQNATPSDWSIYYLDQQQKTPETNQNEIDQKKTNTMKLIRVYVGDPYETGNGQVNTAFIGQDNNKIAISAVGLIESIVAFIIIAPLSVTIIAMKIMLQLLVIALSFLLLLCAFPNTGRKLAYKIANTIVGLVLKQIVTSLVLGVAMALLAIAINNVSPLWALIWIIVMSAAIGKFKGMVMDLTEVNMGGAGAFNTPDPGESINRGFSRVGAVATGAAMGGAAALLGRKGGGNGGNAGTKVTQDAVGSAGTQRAAVPANLASDGEGGMSPMSSPASENSTSNKTAPVRRTPNIPDAPLSVPGSNGSSPQGSAVAGVIPALSGSKSSPVRVTGSAMVKASSMMASRGKDAPKHRAESSRVPVKTPTFMKDGPVAPKAKSTGAVMAEGMARGGARAVMSGSTSIGSGVTAGFTAGREVAADVNSEHATTLREAEREAKAAEKSEEARYQERRKAAEAERVAKEKERKQGSEKVGALPVSKPASKGLPGSTGRAMGLPPRNTSSQSSGGTSRGAGR